MNEVLSFVRDFELQLVVEYFCTILEQIPARKNKNHRRIFSFFTVSSNVEISTLQSFFFSFFQPLMKGFVRVCGFSSFFDKKRSLFNILPKYSRKVGRKYKMIMISSHSKIIQVSFFFLSAVEKQIYSSRNSIR